MQAGAEPGTSFDPELLKNSIILQRQFGHILTELRREHMNNAAETVAERKRTLDDKVRPASPVPRIRQLQDLLQV